MKFFIDLFCSQKDMYYTFFWNISTYTLLILSYFWETVSTKIIIPRKKSYFLWFRARLPRCFFFCESSYATISPNLLVHKYTVSSRKELSNLLRLSKNKIQTDCMKPDWNQEAMCLLFLSMHLSFNTAQSIFNKDIKLRSGTWGLNVRTWHIAQSKLFTIDIKTF